MYIKSYPCEFQVPPDGKIGAFTDLKNSTCTYCDQLCKKSEIDSSIGFTDGFDGSTVWTVYAIIGGLTVLLQIYVCLIKNKATAKKYEEMQNEISRENITFT